MSSPVNLGDVISLLSQVYKVYDAYRSIPDKIRQALKKFEDAEKECRNVNSILATSRRLNFRAWPETADMLADLEAARKYLVNYQPLLDESGNFLRMTRIKKTFKFQWDWSEFEKHIVAIDRHRENLKEFKQTVLIQTAQDNIELQIAAIKLQLGHRMRDGVPVQSVEYDDASSTTSGHISLLSKASRSLRVANLLEPAPAILNHRPQLSPVIESSASTASADGGADDLKAKVATFIEKHGLNRLEIVQSARQQDLEYIAQLPGRWYRRQQGRVSEINQQDSPPTHPVSAQTGSPGLFSVHESLGSSLFDRTGHESSNDSGSIANSMINALNRVNYGDADSARHPVFGRMLPSPALSLDTDNHSQASSADCSEDVEEESVQIEKATITIPWTNVTMPCRMKMVRSEGSLHIQSTSLKTFKPHQLPVINSVTPSDLFHLVSKHGTGSGTEQVVPLVFNHAVDGGLRSFPKVQHPKAEVSSSSSGEYTFVIEFYEHQYLQAEGYPVLSRATKGLVYSFERRSDRDLVRQEIFNKILLASVGIANVKFVTKAKNIPTPCNTQACSLWKARQSVVDDGKDVTLTIQCNRNGKQTKPDCAMEFIVLNFNAKTWDRVAESDDGKLQLELRLVCDLQTTPLSSPVMSGGVTSGDSTISDSSVSTSGSMGQTDQFSMPGARSRQSSFFSRRASSIITTETIRPMENIACTIELTECRNSPSLRRAKQRFLGALKANVQRKPG